MTRHDLQVQRLEAAVASITTSRPDDDLPFLAPAELSLVERLERRIAQARGRSVPARLRRANRDAEDRRMADWEHALEAQADRAAYRAQVVGLDLTDDEPVPFYIDEAEHVARGWSVR
jgi:hypothetical protein